MTSLGPAWDGARNLGDLGGLPLAAGGTTKPGRVYRSAAPEWMTDRGWGDARAAGLTTVIDLRNEMEREVSTGITVVHTPTEDPDDQAFLAECGPWLDHPRSWAANLRFYPDKIARVLTAAAEAEGPVLVHCAGGSSATQRGRSSGTCHEDRPHCSTGRCAIVTSFGPLAPRGHTGAGPDLPASAVASPTWTMSCVCARPSLPRSLDGRRPAMA